MRTKTSSSKQKNEVRKAGYGSALSFSPDFLLELSLLQHGLVAGIDEAGRGALAGPLSVGLVIFPRELIENPTDEIFTLVNDSKKLSARRRELALDYIITTALYADVVLISHATVDINNINGATELAIRRLISRCDHSPLNILLDGNFPFKFTVPCHSVKNGDSRSLSIAAASIIAKVTRDRIMTRFDSRYPGYDFSEHKGYGTALHREKIYSLGPCPIHRETYEPVKSLFLNKGVALVT